MIPAARGRTSRRHYLATSLLALAILVPAGYGFGRKFLELVYLAGTEDGSFALVPVANYLLASLGFLFLFLWAVWHGMFRELERPKHTMLANEARLDAEADEEREAWKEWN